MKVTEEQLLDFLKCSLYYKFKHIEQLPGFSLLEERARCLRTVLYYFYYHTLENVFPALQAIKDAWGRLWYAEDLPLEEIKWRALTKERRLETEAVQGLYNFYTKETGRDFLTIMVDQPFELPIGDHVLVGNIDLIRERAYRVEVVNFYFEKTRNVSLDLSLTIKSFAFRSLYGVKEDRLIGYFLPSCSEVETARSWRHFRMLTGLIEKFVHSIENDVIYPRPSSFCNECSYTRECWYWPEQAPPIEEQEVRPDYTVLELPEQRKPRTIRREYIVPNLIKLKK